MKKYRGYLLSSTLLLSLVSFNSTFALTASDVTMLRTAGIITSAQETSLRASLVGVSIPAVPVRASTALCAVISRDVSFASRDDLNNNAVSVLQNFLSSQGYLTATSRGYFGSLTIGAVKAFQSANGISPTGYVGPITRTRIQNICSGVVGISTDTSLDQLKNLIPSTVSSEIRNTIETQIQNLNTSGTVPATIQSVTSQIPQIECSNFTTVPLCSYLPEVLQARCKVCKGQY